MYWQERFCFLLIDEFQDIDPLQFEIVKNLLSKDKNIMVVGDDDQSIYRFRGADPSVMLNFSQDFPTLKQICLRDNFRSCPEILKDSNRLISKNKNRFKKEIIAFRKEEIGKVELKLFLSSYDEADFLIKRIKENYKPNEFDTIAVIFRTHFTAHLFTEMCYKMKLPFCAIEKITS